MPRPHKERAVHTPPLHSGFKPSGIRGRFLDKLILTLDEFEAIRLADYQGLDHSQSAVKMDISRSTFSRLVEKARHKVAQFLVEGKHLQIEGGEVHFRGNILRCMECGHLMKTTMDSAPEQCESCGSTELTDLAGGFGHGRCCHRHHRGKRR